MALSSEEIKSRIETIEFFHLHAPYQELTLLMVTNEQVEVFEALYNIYLYHKQLVTNLENQINENSDQGKNKFHPLTQNSKSYEL